MINVNDDNFSAEVLESDQLVLVDFWGESCGPCKVLKPKLTALEQQFPQLKICLVNVMENNLYYSKMEKK